jgi:hypothetical protein
MLDKGVDGLCMDFKVFGVGDMSPSTLHAFEVICTTWKCIIQAYNRFSFHVNGSMARIFISHENKISRKICLLTTTKSMGSIVVSARSNNYP